MFSLFRREAKGLASTMAAGPLIAMSQLGLAQWTREKSALTREGVVRNAIGYRCVRMIAEAAASVDWLAAQDHPALAVLKRPNPEQAGAQLLESFYVHLQTYGNAYLHGLTLDDDNESGRQVREIYALQPDRVSSIQGSQGWPLGWQYKLDRTTRNIMREDDGWSPVLHVKLMHPMSELEGMSPLEAAGKAVDVHNAGASWAKALIDNSARPSGALIYGKGGDRLTPEQFDRLKHELEEAHTGALNAGRPMLLEGGLDWKPMGLTPNDMDFIAARHDAAREIALAFGVPPMMLGIPGDNTYSNYKEANIAFWRLTVLPLVEKAGQAIGHWLSQRAQTPIELRPNLERVSALSAERDALWKRLEEANFLDEDEKRAIAGLPKRGDA